ncbi:MAG: hypothetical protein HKN89_08065 [Eudoraea sp.]|nr:hypothetical protein [Eudoraea sp.]
MFIDTNMFWLMRWQSTIHPFNDEDIPSFYLGIVFVVKEGFYVVNG